MSDRDQRPKAPVRTQIAWSYLIANPEVTQKALSQVADISWSKAGQMITRRRLMQDGKSPITGSWRIDMNANA